MKIETLFTEEVRKVCINGTLYRFTRYIDPPLSGFPEYREIFVDRSRNGRWEPVHHFAQEI